MNLLTQQIRDWATDRNLNTADPNKQMLKLMEEVGELAQGMAKSNEGQVIDSIGDIYVVLTILTMQLCNHGKLNHTIEECIAAAYEEIKDRKGEMVDGVFVKEADLR